MFSKRDDLAKVDSCFVIITSHGTEDEENNTEILGTDYNASGQANYEKILCTDVCDYFTVEECPQLADKPKIFIFQLCRYEKYVFIQSYRLLTLYQVITLFLISNLKSKVIIYILTLFY